MIRGPFPLSGCVVLMIIDVISQEEQNLGLSLFWLSDS